MENVARPWMFAYTIFFGLLSAHFVYNDVKNQYCISFIIWDGIYYVLVLGGNLIYSLDFSTFKIRKVWKFIFPIVVLGFVVGGIIDSIYGRHAHNSSIQMQAVVWILGFATFSPTFWAHYKIGYGKEADDGVV
jgi:hypothetical protein